MDELTIKYIHMSDTLHMTISIMAALLLCFALGLEREITNKYAGLRTHILVGLGACVFTLISIYGFPTALSGENPNGIRDTARVAAQVVTGIGFIGAGTVLRNGLSVYGLTTAATLWMAASIGMACGAGCYDIAVIATLVSVLTLTMIRVFEKALNKSTKNVRRIKITINCKSEYTQEIQDFISNNLKRILELGVKQNSESSSISRITTIVELFDRNPIPKMYDKFKNISGIENISVQEVNDIKQKRFKKFFKYITHKH